MAPKYLRPPGLRCGTGRRYSAHVTPTRYWGSMLSVPGSGCRATTVGLAGDPVGLADEDKVRLLARRRDAGSCTPSMKMSPLRRNHSGGGGRCASEVDQCHDGRADRHTGTEYVRSRRCACCGRLATTPQSGHERNDEHGGAFFLFHFCSMIASRMCSGEVASLRRGAQSRT